MRSSKYTGEFVDIDGCISALRSAVYLIPEGHLSQLSQQPWSRIIYRGLPLEVRFQSRAL